MKTKFSWSLDYLNRRMMPRELAEWQNAKRKAQESKFGVKFVAYVAHGKWRCIPAVEFKGTDKYLDLTLTANQMEWRIYILRRAMDMIIEREAITIADMHTLTGYAIKDICNAMRYLLENYACEPVICRTGDCVGVSVPKCNFSRGEKS